MEYRYPQDVASLEDVLSCPTLGLVEAMAQIPGDFVVLGAGGKMGPTLTRMLLRANHMAGRDARVWAVSRFSDSDVEKRLQEWGATTVVCDLADSRQLAAVPSAENVLYLAGYKFGAAGNAPHTWAMNCYLPGQVAQKYPHSRIVALSSGNVYGLVDVTTAGAVEDSPPNPEGEYAMSVLGRERMMQYFSLQQSTPVAILRLNYACELRYGVLVDIARKIIEDQKVDVTMGHVNVIWQRDANDMILRAFGQAETPARIINVAGAETLRVRDLAQRLSELLGRPLETQGKEAASALLSCGSTGHSLLGQPEMPLETMLQWTSRWLAEGGMTLSKPTNFQVRDGKF